MKSLSSCALCVLAVLACLVASPGMAQFVNNTVSAEISTSTVLLSTEYVNTAITISRSIPTEFIPVAVSMPSPRITNAYVRLTGWSDMVAGDYAFSFDMSGAVISNGAFQLVDFLPANSIVNLRNIVGTNHNGAVMVDLGNTALTNNISIVVASANFKYSADANIPFIRVGGQAFSAQVTDFSSLQVLDTYTTNGNCLVSLAAVGTGVSSIANNAVVSITSVQTCGLTEAVMCVAGLLSVSSGSALRLWNVSTSPSTCSSSTTTNSVLGLRGGSINFATSSFLLIKDINAPGSSVIAQTPIDNNVVTTNSVATVHNIEASNFCSGCSTQGLFTVHYGSSAYAGVWRLSGGTVTDYAGNGFPGPLTATGSSSQPTSIDANSKDTSGRCTAATCQPGNYDTTTTSGSECVCQCKDNLDFPTFMPNCFSMLEGSLTHSGCIDPNCVTCPVNAGVCAECVYGYYLIDGACRSRTSYDCTDPNCLSCTASSAVCTICRPNYYPVNGFCTYNTCEVANCITCAQGSGNTCTRCTGRYGLVGGVCLACTDSLCNACDRNVNICTECTNGASLVNGGCVPVSDQCNVANCVSCVAGQNNECAMCDSYYELSSDGRSCKKIDSSDAVRTAPRTLFVAMMTMLIGSALILA